jgi:hypothetical protein
MANDEHVALLKKGVTAWNAWRSKNPHIRPELFGANLSGANLSLANLSKMDLREANLIGAYLNAANLSGVDLTGANLGRAYLTKANLKMLWGGSGEPISIAALSNSMEPRHDETQNQGCERFKDTQRGPYALGGLAGSSGVTTAVGWQVDVRH